MTVRYTENTRVQHAQIIRHTHTHIHTHPKKGHPNFERYETERDAFMCVFKIERCEIGDLNATVENNPS